MEFADRLRFLRFKKRLTLDELARNSGVSKGMLSQIERDLSLPTLGTLQKIARAIGMTLSELLSEEGGSTMDSNKGATNRKSPVVVRKDQRKKLVIPSGIWYEMLCPDLRHRIELIYLHYPVGVHQHEVYSHEGEECGVILEGKLKGFIGDEEVILEQGDSVYYESSIPHRWENIGEKEAKAIWAITPPSF